MTTVAASFFASFDTAAVPGGGAAAGQGASGAFGALLAPGTTVEIATPAALTPSALPVTGMTALLASITDLNAAVMETAPTVVPAPAPPTAALSAAVEAVPPPAPELAAAMPQATPVAPAPSPAKPGVVTAAPTPAAETPILRNPVATEIAPAAPPAPATIASDEPVATPAQPSPAIAQPATPAASTAAKPATAAPRDIAPAVAAAIAPAPAAVLPEPVADTPSVDKASDPAKPEPAQRREETPTEQPAELVLPVTTPQPAPVAIPIAPAPAAAIAQPVADDTPAPAAAASVTARKPSAAAASTTPDAPGPLLDGTAPPISDQRVAAIGDGRDAPSSRRDDGAAALSAAASGERASAAPGDGAPVFTLPSAPAQAAAAQPTGHRDAGVITARPGQIGQELGVAIARHVGGDAATGGGDTITLRLNPVDMGRIEVKLSFDDGGTLRAVVSADNPAALDMLRRDSADLGRALSDAGVRSDTQTLRFDTRAGTGQGGGGGQPGQRDPQSRGGAMSDVLTETPEDITAAYRPLRTRGGVDMVA